MVGSGHGDSVNGLAGLVEELSKVLVKFGVVSAVFLRGTGLQCAMLAVQRVGIDVAKSDDVAAQAVGTVGVSAALSAYADAGDVDAAVEVLPAQERGRDAQHGGGDGRVFDEVTTAQRRSRPGRRIGLRHGGMTCPERGIFTRRKCVGALKR